MQMLRRPHAEETRNFIEGADKCGAPPAGRSRAAHVPAGPARPPKGARPPGSPATHARFRNGPDCMQMPASNAAGGLPSPAGVSLPGAARSPPRPRSTRSRGLVVRSGKLRGELWKHLWRACKQLRLRTGWASTDCKAGEGIESERGARLGARRPRAAAADRCGAPIGAALLPLITVCARAE